MGNKVIWTVEKVNEIENLYHQGFTAEEIAVTMDVKVGSVKNHLRFIRKPTDVQRVPKVLDEKIILLRAKGLSCSEIADLVDKHFDWVNKRIWLLNHR